MVDSNAYLSYTWGSAVCLTRINTTTNAVDFEVVESQGVDCDSVCRHMEFNQLVDEEVLCCDDRPLDGRPCNDVTVRSVNRMVQNQKCGSRCQGRCMLQASHVSSVKI